MDDTREALTEIDRALAEALDVDASPDFAARVRQRIAGETRRTPFWSGWRIAAAAAATVAIALLGLALVSKRSQPAPFLAARSLALEHLRPADVRASGPVLVARRSAPADRSRADSLPVTTARHEPDVLVPREEIEMYRRLIADAQNAPHALVVESPRDIVSVGLITDITIDPIKIDLIAPPVGGEGDRQ